ncbi:MAG: DMT family transporter [Bacteroidales bacterium]|nr:DMT family transporter [Bacteroidales bacterium]MDD3891969.1 DMT family transporter [Bacteroidales bacterium]
MLKKTVGVYLSAIVAMVFWAFSFIWYKEVLVAYKPISLVLMRLIISSVLLIAVTASLGRLNRIKRKDIKTFILMSFLSPFLYFLGESYGVSYMPSTVAAVIIATIPLFSPIGAYYYLNERISIMNFLGIVVSVVGVGLVVFHKGLNLSDVHPIGIAFMLLAVVSALGYSLIVKKLADRYNVFSIVAYQNLIGVFFFLPLFFLLDFKQFIQVVPTWDVIKPLLSLGVFASTFAFIFFTYAIKNLGISKANIFTNAIPVLTAILAFFILDEEITPVKMAGILVVVLGLFLSQLRRGMFKGLFRKKDTENFLLEN